MDATTVTQKGQVTIPIEFRREFNIEEGSKVAFSRYKGKLVLTPIKKLNLMDLAGSLPKPKKALTIEQINTIIKSKK